MKGIREIVGFSLALIVFLTLGASNLAIAAEKAYPTKEINMYIGFSPGGGTDATGRVICSVMEKALGVPIVVINKAGATSALATAYVANSTPDGYTLLYTLTPYAVMKKIEEPGLAYSLDKLTLLGSSHKLYIFLAVRSNSPWKKIEDFIDYAKNNPVKFAAIGSLGPERYIQTHFAEYFGFKKITQVPYPAANEGARALLGGEVDAVVQANPAAQFVKSGDFRFLAVFAKERNPSYPDVPAIAEKGKGYDRFFLYRTMLIGPKGLPGPVVDKLTKTFKEAGQSESVNKAFMDIAFSPEYLSPEKCIEEWKQEEKSYTELFKRWQTK